MRGSLICPHSRVGILLINEHKQHVWNNGAKCNAQRNTRWLHSIAVEEESSDVLGVVVRRKRLTVFAFGLPLRTSRHQLVNALSWISFQSDFTGLVMAEGALHPR